VIEIIQCGKELTNPICVGITRLNKQFDGIVLARGWRPVSMLARHRETSRNKAANMATTGHYELREISE
jgi:hypothetical protein